MRLQTAVILACLDQHIHGWFELHGTGSATQQTALGEDQLCGLLLRDEVEDWLVIFSFDLQVHDTIMPPRPMFE